MRAGRTSKIGGGEREASATPMTTFSIRDGLVSWSLERGIVKMNNEWMKKKAKATYAGSRYEYIHETLDRCREENPEMSVARVS